MREMNEFSQSFDEFEGPDDSKLDIHSNTYPSIPPLSETGLESIRDYYGQLLHVPYSRRCRRGLV